MLDHRLLSILTLAIGSYSPKNYIVGALPQS